MGIQEIFEKIKEIKEKRAEEEAQLDDNETRDKALRSLRRERRIQNEVIEKEQLKKKIAEFKKERMRQHLFGIKSRAERAEQTIFTLRKSKLKPKQCSFLGKSNL